MAYRKPAIYASEVAGPRLSVNTNNNAVIAFIGEAVGHLTASQQLSLIGETGIELVNKGAVSDSYIITNRATGAAYVLDTDFSATQVIGVDGTTTSIKRKLTTSTHTATTVAAKSFTYFDATPSMDVLVGEGGVHIAGTYIIKGTVVVTDDSVVPVPFVEDSDFVIDYYTGIMSAKTGGDFTNGDVLKVTYKYCTAEPLELLADGSDTFAHRYVSKSSIGASTVVLQFWDTGAWVSTGAEGGYVEDVDFIIDYTTGKISLTASSRIPVFVEADENYMYAAYSYGAIKSADVVTCTYDYKPTDYYDAKYFTSYNDLTKTYGGPYDSQGTLQSPLSLAAYLASKNGMSGCWAVAVDTVAGWESAIAKLEVVSVLDIIVPLTGISSTWQYVIEHCNLMLDSQDERRAIFGADGTAVPVASATMISYAQAIAAKRGSIVSPSSFKFTNPTTNIVGAIPAYYMAAAIAGYDSSVKQSTSLTGKIIKGFYGANESRTKNEELAELSGGLMFVEPNANGMRIVHGRTTSNASFEEREWNISIVADYIPKVFRSMFSDNYIGALITGSTTAEIAAAVKSKLNILMEGGYIYSFDDGVNVYQSAEDPSCIKVEFSYQPIYGINYIDISFVINSAAGTVQ